MVWVVTSISIFHKFLGTNYNRWYLEVDSGVTEKKKKCRGKETEVY